LHERGRVEIRFAWLVSVVASVAVVVVVVRREWYTGNRGHEAALLSDNSLVKLGHGPALTAGPPALAAIAAQGLKISPRRAARIDERARHGTEQLPPDR
jgi:hypothetical protein